MNSEDRFTPNSKRLMRVSYTHHLRYGKFPFIRITGKYLTDFDFEIGDTIELKVEMGRITITKVSVCSQ